MILLVIAAMAALGGTTWLVLEQPVARDPVRNQRLSMIGLLVCLVSAMVALAAVFATAP
ncbi:hypothetical protein [Actinoplanes siamensis]|uniref:hypothetical protein n=1 Tax=Actinoplanes siamensis TaxID=1223317 RepID=UPI00194116FB|nr:hypothetical protein [Actinoplanes siamensis]